MSLEESGATDRPASTLVSITPRIFGGVNRSETGTGPSSTFQTRLPPTVSPVPGLVVCDPDPTPTVRETRESNLWQIFFRRRMEFCHTRVSYPDDS